MTAALLILITVVATIAAVVRKIAQKRATDIVVKEMKDIGQKAQKEIDDLPDVPVNFSREEVRNALRDIRNLGDQ